MSSSSIFLRFVLILYISYIWFKFEKYIDHHWSLDRDLKIFEKIDDFK